MKFGRDCPDSNSSLSPNSTNQKLLLVLCLEYEKDIIFGMRASAGFRVNNALRAAARMLAALLAGAIVLSILACGGDEDILAFAAISLREPLTEIGEMYELHSGVNVNLSFGGSQSMGQQIASGAPADVFISAGKGPMDFLAERDLVENSEARRLLGNELVIVMINDSDEIDSMEALASDDIDRVALANPALAPAGAYAEEALRSTGIWDALQNKLLLGKDVRAAMSYVAVGNADAGIVYRTDALASDSLKIVHSVGQNLHSSVIYPAAVVRGSSNRSGASAYLDFLASEEAMSVFRRYGFAAPPP